MNARRSEPESVMDPASESLAGVYADALLAQVPSDGEAEEVADELDAIVELLDAIDGFEDLLTAALIGHDERCELLERIFHGRVSEPVEATLQVMGAAGRLGLLRTLRRVYRSRLHRRQGKREVTVTTAVALDDAQQAQVHASLAETLGAEPVITWRVDDGLLGGMVVRVGDHVYDASLQAELGHLQQRLSQQVRLDVPVEGDRQHDDAPPRRGEGSVT